VTGPKIAACLIVKDAAQTIEQCLASIRPFVDGVFVYDTGSTDGTLKVLKKLAAHPSMLVSEGQIVCPSKYEPGDPAAKLAEGEQLIPLAPITVEQGEWRDDFAWAREQSFAMPDDSYDWVMWLDDDDAVQGAQWLRQMAATAHPDLDGFIFQYDYARDENGACVCVLWRERLLRRAAGYVWREPIHEVLVPPDGRPSRLAVIPPEQVKYVHRRDLAPPDRYAPDRNLRILTAKAQAAHDAGEPVDPRTLAYLGTEHMAKGDWPTAANYLQAYVEHPGAGWGDERAQVHHKLATCLRAMGNVKASIHVELESVKERCDWAENYIGLAQAYGAMGDWKSRGLVRRADAEGEDAAVAADPEPARVHARAAARPRRGARPPGPVPGGPAALGQAMQTAPLNGMAREHAARIETMIGENEIVGAGAEAARGARPARREPEGAPADGGGAVHRRGAPEIVKAKGRSAADGRPLPAAGRVPPLVRRGAEGVDRRRRDRPERRRLHPARRPRPRPVPGVRGGARPQAARPRPRRERHVARLLPLGERRDRLRRRRAELAVDREGPEAHRDVRRAGRATCRATSTTRAMLLATPEIPAITDDRHRARRPRPRYDLVLLFEVLEHVPDMNRTFEVLESLCEPRRPGVHQRRRTARTSAA
jgi:glycosyltransferase involved in cell wall biosynthesis